MWYRGSLLGHFYLPHVLFVAGEATVSGEITTDLSCPSSSTITAYNFMVVQTEYMYINRTVETITVTWDLNTTSASSGSSPSVSESSSTSSQTAPTSTNKCANPTFFDTFESFYYSSGTVLIRYGAFWDTASLRYITTEEYSLEECARRCVEEMVASGCRFFNYPRPGGKAEARRCERFRDGQQCQEASSDWICGRLDSYPVASSSTSVGSIGDGSSTTSTVDETSASPTSEDTAVSSTIGSSTVTENTVIVDPTSAGESTLPHLREKRLLLPRRATIRCQVPQSKSHPSHLPALILPHGYLYGVQGYTTNSGFEISPRLVRFTEDPATFEILADIPEFCGSNIGIGDVDNLGHMWIKCQDNKWMEYDIPSGDFTNPKSGTTDITPPAVLDWVWMPDDPNALFSISTSPEGVFLWRFDRTDHTWDKVGNDAGYAGPPFPSNGQINAMYGSRLGYIYAREATEGKTYRFSVKNTTLAQLVIGDTQERQTDGARCVVG